MSAELVKERVQEISEVYHVPTWSWVLRELEGIYNDQTAEGDKVALLKMLAEVLALKARSETSSK